MQFSDRQVNCTDRAYNYPIVRIERIDNPPVDMMVVNEIQFSNRKLHLTGRLSLSIRTGCTMTFFRSCQLESTRNIHVCLLYCATLFPVVTECNFRMDIQIMHKIIQSYGPNESTTLLSTWWSLARCNFRTDSSI